MNRDLFYSGLAAGAIMTGLAPVLWLIILAGMLGWESVIEQLDRWVAMFDGAARRVETMLRRDGIRRIR